MTDRLWGMGVQGIQPDPQGLSWAPLSSQCHQLLSHLERMEAPRNLSKVNQLINVRVGLRPIPV